MRRGLLLQFSENNNVYGWLAPRWKEHGRRAKWNNVAYFMVVKEKERRSQRQVYILPSSALSNLPLPPRPHLLTQDFRRYFRSKTITFFPWP